MQLLLEREQELRVRHGIAFRITGIASRRLGWIADHTGLDPRAYVAGALPPAGGLDSTNVRTWLSVARADILFEATSLNVENGQPAVDHIRAALNH